MIAKFFTTSSLLFALQYLSSVSAAPLDTLDMGLQRRSPFDFGIKRAFNRAKTGFKNDGLIRQGKHKEAAENALTFLIKEIQKRETRKNIISDNAAKLNSMKAQLPDDKSPEGQAFYKKFPSSKVVAACVYIHNDVAQRRVALKYTALESKSEQTQVDTCVGDLQKSHPTSGASASAAGSQPHTTVEELPAGEHHEAEPGAEAAPGGDMGAEEPQE